MKKNCWPRQGSRWLVATLVVTLLVLAGLLFLAESMPAKSPFVYTLF